MKDVKKCRMSNGILIIPISWHEINPKAAKFCKHLAICSDGQNRTAIYYLKFPLEQLSDQAAAEILSQARAVGLGVDAAIYGFIEDEKYNNSGAKFIKN